MDLAGNWKDKKDIPDIDKLRDECEGRLDQIYSDRCFKHSYRLFKGRAESF